ncbi:MAG: ABC transporter substrate-binding protein [Spirochaetales bacterium]|nr:ABC transporter substrate-binding protein [Spirochaetales bacterium]
MKRCISLFVSLLLFGAVLFAGGQGEDDDVLQVAATFGDLGNPFFFTMGQGVEDAARAIDPDARVTVVSSGYDLNTQTGQMDTFISAGVDIIVLNAADTAGIAPAVRRAKEAGIIVVAADVNADGGVDATVTSNNYQAGTQAGEYIVERLGGQGNVVIINGPPVSAVIDRVAGAQDVFAQHPGITVLSDNQNAGGNREGGLRVMTDLLTAFDRIDAVFAINDPTGIGADLAIQQAQRAGEMFIVGVDGAPDAVVALNQPGSDFVATPSQDPYEMARRAVEIGHEIMQGQEPADELILIPTALITRDNVDEYDGWTQPE